MDKSKSRATKPGVTCSSHVGCTLDSQSALCVGVQREISTLPYGTQVDPDLLRVPAIAEAISAAMPADGGLQLVLGGWYEVVDLRVSQ